MTDDDIGYGKPPIARRWQAGQSGNQKGRPKASKAELLASMADILSSPVMARGSDGKAVELGGLEAGYLALCRTALKGDNGALFQAIKIMLEVIPAGKAVMEERDADVRGAKERFLQMAKVNRDEQGK